jgi:hypothetical protein
VIHAFALEPQLVATWGRREEFRFIHDKFGLGTPRVLLELPAFSKWKRKVYEAATELALSQEDTKRVEELFRLFSEHRHRRTDAAYDGLLSWLENAEREHARKQFTGILAARNPRNHAAVLLADQLGLGTPRWACKGDDSPLRTPEALAHALSAMLTSCQRIHLVDPHFGPENARHRRVLEALLKVVGEGRLRVHCSGNKSTLAFFEQEAAKMASRFPLGVSVEFVRWRKKPEGQRFHNRYVLTDIGGVMFGDGLDDDDGAGGGQTDDLHLLSREQYRLRWTQYVDENGAFDCVDRPVTIVGSKPSGGRRGQ